MLLYLAMHELSIAQQIVEIVKKAVNNDISKVLRVKLKIGAMAGVVSDSLKFSFQAITAGTPLQKAQLVVEEIPFTIECKNCKAVSECDVGIMVCPHCHSTQTRIISGNELHVTEIEVEDCKTL